MTKSLLVIGGARSGKSRYAQTWVEGVDGALAFIATAAPGDAEMRDRIARHRADRGARWTAFEAPIDLPATIRTAEAGAAAILVDCVTLWLSNLLLREHDLEAAAAALMDAIDACRVPIALVSNEVGSGIVPMSELGRRFRDEAGLLNQRLAQTVDEVVLVAAGLPLTLK